MDEPKSADGSTRKPVVLHRFSNLEIVDSLGRPPAGPDEWTIYVMHTPETSTPPSPGTPTPAPAPPSSDDSKKGT